MTVSIQELVEQRDNALVESDRIIRRMERCANRMTTIEHTQAFNMLNAKRQELVEAVEDCHDRIQTMMGQGRVDG